MRVLVLGATGGTGREIVREAQAQGHAVTALVRSPERAQGLSGVHLVAGNACDAPILLKALEECDGVISALGTRHKSVQGGHIAFDGNERTDPYHADSRRQASCLHHRNGSRRQPGAWRLSLRPFDSTAFAARGV
ncbi:NAD(P)-dependent oxidoreductase [Microvirga roseola]|uniref:NAD(P)-dependent oxidoreductase n=1 Tax=Microvirga roseola TaxID=2883126 RepID=UPI003898E0CF